MYVLSWKIFSLNRVGAIGSLSLPEHRVSAGTVPTPQFSGQFGRVQESFDPGLINSNPSYVNSLWRKISVIKVTKEQLQNPALDSEQIAIPEVVSARSADL